MEYLSTEKIARDTYLFRRTHASPMTTLTSPIDLLAAVPFMIGFEPSDSLVLMGLRNESVDVAMRIDFPEVLDLDQIALLITHLKENSIEEALVVSYIPESVSDADVVIKALSEALESAGFPLRESLIVVSGRWRSLICGDLECCPMEGHPLPSIESSRIAAEQIVQGQPFPYKDENELLHSIEPNTDGEIEEIISQIPEIDDESDPRAQQREGAEAFVDFINDFKSDGICRDKKLVALVLVRMRDLQVRDFVMGSVKEEEINLYFDAYRWLMKIAPGGYIAPIASVFAAICYERGDGALAQRVLTKALLDDEKYPLAMLLKELFTRGKRPEIFCEMRAELHPKVCDVIFSGTLAM